MTVNMISCLWTHKISIEMATVRVFSYFGFTTFPTSVVQWRAGWKMVMKSFKEVVSIPSLLYDYRLWGGYIIGSVNKHFVYVQIVQILLLYIFFFLMEVSLKKELYFTHFFFFWIPNTPQKFILLAIKKWLIVKEWIKIQFQSFLMIHREDFQVI